jgi:hypothetical protein
VAPNAQTYPIILFLFVLPTDVRPLILVSF